MKFLLRASAPAKSACAICWENIILHSHPEIEISFKFIPKILMSKECVHFLGRSVLINLSTLSFWLSTIKVAVLWHEYPCCSVDRYHRFRRNSLLSFGNLEDASSESATNDGTYLPNYTTSHSRRQHHSSSTSFRNGSGQLTKRNWAAVV